MRYISLFSGIEAASVAWSNLGWEPLAFSEIEEFPCAVLKKRFPEVPNLGDVTKIDWKEWKNAGCDIIVGGSPCQSFSVAGNRTGLAGASGLMWEYVRAVQAIRPQWVVWENVPGALSSSHGEDFRCLLESMDELGYGLAWRVLDAQFFGVAQRRRRVFLVGHLGDRRAAEVLFESEGLSWDYPSSREKRQALTRGIENGTRATGRSIDWNRTDGRCRWPDDPTLVQTLSAHMGTGGDNVPPVYQIAGNIIGRGDMNGGHQLGVTDPDENGAFTLTGTDRHAVEFAQNQRDEVRDLQDCAGALAAEPGIKQQTFVYCATDSGSHAAVERDFAPTLTAHDAKSTSYVFGADNAASGGLSLSEETSPTLGTTKTPAVKPSLSGMVRRLTPVECERLQGFPTVVDMKVSEMNRDEIVACALANGDIEADIKSGRLYTHRGPGGIRLEKRKEIGLSNSNGYRVAHVSANGIKKQIRVHRAIYIAAFGGIPSNLVIDHINNDKTDNRISNLQAITPADNSRKAERDGKYIHHCKVDVEMRTHIFHEYSETSSSYSKLAQKYGISKSRVAQIIQERGYTDIPYRGKQHSPDSARYKALGNSMCTHVMEWIGKRIQEVEGRCNDERD